MTFQTSEYQVRHETPGEIKRAVNRKHRQVDTPSCNRQLPRGIPGHGKTAELILSLRAFMGKNKGLCQVAH